MWSESKNMDRDKLIATLQQIKTIVDDALGDVARDGAGKGRSAVRETKRKSKAMDISFNVNILAFMNKHARGLKGPQRFTLLLARLVKGSTTEQMSIGEKSKSNGTR